MKKYYLTILFTVLIYHLNSAQSLKKEYQEVVQTFIDCVENKNLEKLKTLVNYPLQREYPIPDIHNESEFIERYAEVFDDALIGIIINSDVKNEWSAVGWRGIMLQRGKLWLDHDGKLIGINHETNFERDKRISLIENDKKFIHKSIHEYKDPILIMETDKFRIRIDEISNDQYRYASWNIHTNMNQAPDLIIYNGTVTFEGSGGNHSYEFVNGKYKYVCSINIIGRIDSSDADLIISKDDTQILFKPAQIVR